MKIELEGWGVKLTFGKLTIRQAGADDARQLEIWWNDGRIMAHAGFPLGTGQKAEAIAASLAGDSDEGHRRLILEEDQVPIGEMNYRNMGGGVAQIGIKICDSAKQNRGLGKIFLSMLIQTLLFDRGYGKIILDTNADNKRAQHVYRLLGFKELNPRENSWLDQLGRPQSSIDYELYPGDFNPSYIKDWLNP